MQSSTDFSLDSAFPAAAESRRGALVQDRPTLGSLPRARRGLGWWLPPVVDLVSSSVALAAVTLIAGMAVFPAFPIAPLLLVAVNGMLGVYGANAPKSACGGEDGMAWPVIRLLMAAVFAWATSLITPLDGGSQLALWISFAVLDTAGRALTAPLRGRLDSVERWVLVSDEATAERLKGYEPLRAYASVVCTVEPFEDRSNPADRVAALEIVDRYQADRVVIGTQHADDESLLDLVRAFKSIGVPVSMLPRPLDLLEAPAVNPNQVGGVPLIEVEALAARHTTPYTGPDRRSSRQTKVSVVVPAMNEAQNIGHVLRQLPAEGLHEVILVDGNSEDDTIEAARSAYPEIRVLVQSGRGKGDAFRTGFAAVTGNLVVMLDADGSADPAEIPRFVEALEAGADFAKGSRYLPGGGSTDITGLRSLGNRVLSGSANLLHGTRFTDLCYGYNAFWARCLPFIALDVPGFEVETLINLRIAGAGMKITEVPSYELDRIHGESNLNTFRDGFRVLGTILSEARRRRRTVRPARPDSIGSEQREARTIAT
jgi:hypothetical protein